MVASIGRNVNTNDEVITTQFTINDSNAVVIAPANETRIFFEVWLVPGSSNIIGFIRLFPAGTNDDKKGVVLIRNTMGNINQFTPSWRMAEDNIYTGEISAISESGDIDIIVIEY